VLQFLLLYNICHCHVDMFSVHIFKRTVVVHLKRFFVSEEVFLTFCIFVLNVQNDRVSSLHVNVAWIVAFVT